MGRTPGPGPSWGGGGEADVVAALTALPNLEQLTWCSVSCSEEKELSDSSLLQHLTRLTYLELEEVKAAALQHLGSLTKLQHLSISAAQDWAAADCPRLQDLHGLTSLKLGSSDLDDLPASVSQLTALRQLEVQTATPTSLNQLQVLSGLTQLCVWEVTGLSPESPPLKLQGLQHLDLTLDDDDFPMPMSFLASCTRLHFLRLQGFGLQGPGTLSASTMLQHLELACCSSIAADGAVGPAGWQQVFPGPGRLPHLTSLQLLGEPTTLHQADMEGMVACCSNLKELGCDTLSSSCAPALARLPGLTSLQLHDTASDEQCSTLVQLTALRQLELVALGRVSVVGLRQLAALQQLTSLGFGVFNRPNQLATFAQHLMKDNLPDCQYALINKVRTWYCVCLVLVGEGGPLLSPNLVQASLGSREGGGGLGPTVDNKRMDGLRQSDDHQVPDGNDSSIYCYRGIYHNHEPSMCLSNASLAFIVVLHVSEDEISSRTEKLNVHHQYIACSL